MRHALVQTHLIQGARAATPLVERASIDAPPDPPAAERRPRRLATLAHRARALVVRAT